MTHFESKIIDIIEIPNFDCLAISSFDRSIMLWNLNKNLKFFTIKLTECSCHTLKFYQKLNYLFVATFEPNVKVFSLDISRDYTRIGRLDHHSTVAAMEIFEKEEMLMTVDEVGDIKTWSLKTLKNLQHSKLGSNHQATCIIAMRKIRRFCIVTNRLNFYGFSNESTGNEKVDQVVPHLRYSPGDEELTVALINDIRVFNMKYGVLAEIYDKEMWNVSEKIIYMKRLKKKNRIMFSDYDGIIKQLDYNNEQGLK